MSTTRKCPVCDGLDFRVIGTEVCCSGCGATAGTFTELPAPHVWTGGLHEHGRYMPHSHEVRADHRGVQLRASGAGSPSALVDVSTPARMGVHMVRAHALPEYWVASRNPDKIGEVHAYQHAHYEHTHTHPVPGGLIPPHCTDPVPCQHGGAN